MQVQPKLGVLPENREGAKNSGGKIAGRSPAQVSTGPPAGSAPGFGWVHTQLGDQWNFTGVTPEWSDSEEPAQVGTCDLPVIKWQVLGLPFSTAIFRTLPIRGFP